MAALQQEDRESVDERLGMNVRVIRERKGISQAELARLMAEHGHAWHQQTVFRVEKGAQSVRFVEAVDLAKILETSLDRLTWASAEANATEALYSAGTRVRRSAAKVTEAVFRLLADTRQAEIINKGTRTKSPRVDAAREDLLSSLDECTVEAAVSHGIVRYQDPTVQDN